MITPTELYNLYLIERKSVAQIADIFDCSKIK